MLAADADVYRLCDRAGGDADQGGALDGTAHRRNPGAGGGDGTLVEVVEDLFGTGEWPLGIDDPIGLAGWAQVLGEAAGVGERLQPTGEV